MSGIFFMCSAPPRRRANAASRRACNLDPLRAYIANIDSGLRIHPDDRAESAAFPSLGHPRGRAVSLRGRFDKDKSGEKLAESEEDLLEHRIDGTDAFDTLYIGCEKFPYRDAFNLSMSGVL